MIEFFQRFFIGHSHVWVERSSHPVDDDPYYHKNPGAYVVVLKCKICGRLRNHKIEYRTFF